MADDNKPTKAEHELAMAQIEADSFAHLGHIEKKLGLPVGYYKGLREGGSDWEFAIKLVVVLEAALGAVIAAHVQNPVLVEHASRLGLEGRAGKLNLAVDLGIMSKPERTAYQALALIRNNFAHHLENIERSLEEFAQSMKPDDLKRYVRDALQVPKEIEEQVKFLWEPVESLPGLLRKLMWTSGSMLLQGLAIEDRKAEVDAARRKQLESGNLWSLADLFRTGGLGYEPSLLGSDDAEAGKPARSPAQK